MGVPDRWNSGLVSPIQSCVCIARTIVEQSYIRVFITMRFLRLLRTCIDKMVNCHDPAILLKDYSAFRTFRISIDIDSLLVALS